MSLDYQELLVISQAFQKDTNLRDWAGLSREDFVFLITRLLGTEDFDQAVLLLEQIVAGQLTAPSLPPDLALFTQEWLEAQKEKEAIKRQVAEKVSAWVRKQKELAATKTSLEIQEPSLKEDPSRSEKAAFEIREIIISSLLQNPQMEIAELWPQINEKLQENGVALGQEKGRALVAQITAQTQEEIAQIRKIAPPPIPKAVVDQLSSQNEPVAFTPLYQVMVPQVAAATLGKVATWPLVKFLQNAQEKMSPEWQQILESGLFVENVEETIQTLKNSGLPPTHPLLGELEKKRERLSKEQRGEDGKDKFIVNVLKAYHRPAELTNKPLYDPETKIPLVRKTAWQKGAGFAFQLKEGLNRLSFGLRLSQKIPVGVAQTKWRFLPTAKIVTFLSGGRFSSLGGLNTFLWRKTVGQVALRLGKTGLGRAAKAGMAKAAGWVAGKVGIKLGLAAAGTAVAPGVGTAVSVALGFVLDLGQKLLKPLFSKISIALKEPHKALGFVLFGAAIVFFLPTISLVGFVLIGLGAVGLLGSAGGFLGGVASGTVSFFTALFSLPASTAPIAALTLGILGGLSALTFFIVMTTSGAFILPSVKTAPILAGSAYIEILKTASRTSLKNEDLPTKITYMITVKAKTKKLENVQIIDKTTVSKEGAAPSVPEKTWSEGEITASWTQTYEIEVNQQFQDSLLTNIVTVTANVDGSHQINSTSITITIGSPPEDCPSGWPTTYGVITQGPNGTYSHMGREAIDIGVNLGTPALATHRGVVTLGENGYYGDYILLKGRCQGKEIETYYLSFLSRSVRNGQEVHRGEGLGLIGSHGQGPHLHYEFKSNLKMEPPYIPVKIPSGCEGCLSW